MIPQSVYILIFENRTGKILFGRVKFISLKNRIKKHDKQFMIHRVESKNIESNLPNFIQNRNV